MKYIIELTDNQKKQMDFMLDMANKHMGFNRKLEMEIPRPMAMEETPAYKKGFEDGNKIADKNFKEIQDSACDAAYNKGLEDAEMANRYFYDTDKKLLSIPEKVSLWKEEKKKAEEETIKVGDIIYSGMTDTKAIIISFDAWDNWNCIDTCGTGFAIDVSKMEFWEKIGHIDGVEQLLDKLRGVKNDRT